jgi:uncharacterized NAD(P)/FAD-binding protein YdhS
LRVDKVVPTLELGRILATEFAVLATGNDTKPDLSGIPAVKPWSQATLAKIDGVGSVLIIGTGLTMVDQVLSLARQGHDGKIIALSPRGLLPSANRHTKPFVLNKDIPFGAELSSIAGLDTQYSGRDDLRRR